MEPGPLPPHERSWRHPSELGPTRFDVDDTAPRPHVSLLALAGGTLAVVAIAAMVVAMTPRPSSGPVALSATTTPITARPIIEAPTQSQVVPATATIEIRQSTALLTSFAAFPHAITAGPELDVDGTELADAAPADDDLVYLRTEAVTYRLPWNEAKQLATPDGTVVFDDEGELVARVTGGELVSLVGE